MRALCVTLDGGGNLPPELGIAAELVRRGGEVRFLGHEAQRRAIESAGFAFESFTRGRDYVAAAPRSTLKALMDLTGIFADHGIGQDALASIERSPVDVVVVDCLLWAATLDLAEADAPVISLVHSIDAYFAKNARGPVGLIASLRGGNAVAALRAPQLTLVATRREFEPDNWTPNAPTKHVGFVWQGTPVEAVPDPERPRVLVSFSTTSFPGQARALQHVLDAFDGLPVEVVVTTGAVDPAELRAPANARVERSIDHGELLPTTSLVIGHGGHSTTARALTHGIPVLVMPMHPLMDQPMMGRAVERLAVGRVLPKSAKPARIRATVESMLADATLRDAVTCLGTSARERDGAAAAADALEARLVTAG